MKMWDITLEMGLGAKRQGQEQRRGKQKKEKGGAAKGNKTEKNNWKQGVEGIECNREEERKIRVSGDRKSMRSQQERKYERTP